jgi:hypothetical protein
MDYVMVGGVAESVANARHVIAAPHRGSVSLYGVIEDQVAEHGELIGKRVI